jgi:diguanylate cyclase (GGDEF)-like protein/PAS domain S-box-containing protein
MVNLLDTSLPLILIAACLCYLWLAIVAARVSPTMAGSPISYFLLLIGGWLAGCAFEYGAADGNIYGIGRTLTFLSTGFLPVVVFAFSLEYSDIKRKRWLMAAVSIVPLITVVLTVTNSLHHLIWNVVEAADGGIRFTTSVEHPWFNLVHTPYSYGLFTLSAFAIGARLPAITVAHRRRVMLLLFCMALPFFVSFAEVRLTAGLPEFPYTACILTMLLPLYWWAAFGLRVYEFSPLAYRTMFDKVRDPIIVLDKHKCIVSANKPAQELLGYPERELIGKQLWEDYPEARELLDHVTDHGLRQTVRMRNGRFFELHGAPLDNRDGLIVVCRDVTERKNAQRALADSEQLIRSLVENSSNGILRFKRNLLSSREEFLCSFANGAAERYLQWGEGNLLGASLERLKPLDPGKLLHHFLNPESNHASLSYELEIPGDHNPTWLRIVAEPVGDDFSVTLIDITQRKSEETKILQDALRDPLTGALNRRGFESVGAPLVKKNDYGAVIYLDLNNFKEINDDNGHQAGDALLKAFCHRLEFCLRPEDVLGRLGGDEFAIILPAVGTAGARKVLQRLEETAAEPYLLHGKQLNCKASIGVAMFPTHGIELWELIDRADNSMYRAKQESRSKDRSSPSAGETIVV